VKTCNAFNGRQNENNHFVTKDESGKNLVKKYDVGTRTSAISDIKKNGELILNFVPVSESEDRSTIIKTRKWKMAKRKLLFVNDAYKKGQVDSLFQGQFCVKKL
jgi:hypothetical protein